MEVAHDTNKVLEEDGPQEVYKFKYDLINTPWDDRTSKSKVSIIVLLVSIFLAIAVLVINGLVIQYRGFSAKSQADNFEINCNLVNIQQYKFIALLISVETKELLCVGAVVSYSGILANHLCVRSGPVRIRLGSPADPRCRKTIATDVREMIHHDGLASNNLVLLITDENIRECSEVIPVGLHLDHNAKAYIIGRPFYTGTSLARRQVTVTGKGNCTLKFDERSSITKLNMKSTICVKDYALCPVRAGDVLVQNNLLFGLASTSVHRLSKNKIVYFADLTLVRDELRALDVQVKTDLRDKTADTDAENLRNMAGLITFALDLKNETTSITNVSDFRNGLAKLTEVDSHDSVVTNVSGITDTTIIQSDVVNNTVDYT